MSSVDTHFERKEDKVRSFRKERYICGYSKSSKAYKIYFLGYKNINISKDVTFDEDTGYKKSRKRPVEDTEEAKPPRIHETTMNKEIQEEDQELEEPQEPVDPPQEKNPHKRKPAWVRKIIQGAKRYGALEENHREIDLVQDM